MKLALTSNQFWKPNHGFLENNLKVCQRKKYILPILSFESLILDLVALLELGHLGIVYRVANILLDSSLRCNCTACRLNSVAKTWKMPKLIEFQNQSLTKLIFHCFGNESWPLWCCLFNGDDMTRYIRSWKL